MLIKQRDCFLDNTKFILIVLVLIGHIIEPLITKSAEMKGIYLWIYSFHMPLFIVITGYFAKTVIERGKRVNTLGNLLLQYVVFQIIYTCFQWIIFGDRPGKLFILWPYWILWYLASVFWWYFITPYFIRIKKSIAWAIVIAILAGYLDYAGNFISLSRTINFYPFFLIGYFAKKEYYNKLSSLKLKVASVIFLVALAIGFYEFAFFIDQRWFYGNYTYPRMGFFEWYSGGYRLVIYLVQALASVAVLILIPHQSTIFTKYGSLTIYPYLLHGFVMKLLIFYGVYDNLTKSPIKQSALIFAGGLLAILFCTQPVRLFFGPIIDFKKNLFKPILKRF